jgi:putative CocE/NonD family hydrolase
LNGVIASEGDISAATAGHFGVPVVMVSGDNVFIEKGPLLAERFHCFARGAAVAIVAFLAATGCSDQPQHAQPVLQGGPAVHSVYVPMPDGVRLAVDVWLPEGVGEAVKAPSIVEFTRYWRATETQPPASQLTEYIQQSLNHGYAYVVVDVRGSGASFGVREAEFSLAEVRDMPNIIDWIAAQPWSNGKVVSMGRSYTGNTAELAALYRSPALVAAVPRFTDYDWYTSIVIPGGVKNSYITERWGNAVRKMDLNDVSLFGNHQGAVTPDNPKIVGVKPVDEDTSRSLLAQATKIHASNHSLADNLGTLTYRDEYPSATSLGDGSGKAASIHDFQQAFEASALPMYHWGSWFDAGTAAGVLARFTRFDAPYQYVIGAWSHGARFDANPYKEKDAAVEPSVDEQFDRIFEFADSVWRGSRQGSAKELVYYTVGEDAWKTTSEWPPAGHTFRRMWFNSGFLLTTEPPDIDGALDEYKVNFDAGSGTLSRWSTQLGGGDVWYGDRAEADRKLLTYTSAPLGADQELTGTAIVALEYSSTHDDGAIIVYLEDVDESGYVRMLTEGVIRPLHRTRNALNDAVFGPQRSFESKDGRRSPPGEISPIKLALLPVSALIRKGHSIRVAIAGHDKDTFIRTPSSGDPVIRIHRSEGQASYIDLPVVQSATELH